MSILSIFVDETGNFSTAIQTNPFYILTFVFHDQDISIAADVEALKASLVDTKHQTGKAIHTGPIIRRDESYANQTIDERRKQFFRLMAFVRKCPINYKSFSFSKREYNGLDLIGRMSRELSLFIRENMVYFSGFDNVIIYYDNGQAEVGKVLSSVFNALLFEVEIRNVEPAEYYLFQAADFICTMELLALKRENNLLNKSDTMFFYKSGELLREIKVVRKKLFVDQ